jgi:hypothetical protein
MARSAVGYSEEACRGFTATDEFVVPTLAQVYEDHAEDCIRAAARTDDPKPRDMLLHLAVKWRDDAQALRCAAQHWSLPPLRIAQIYEDHAEDYIRAATGMNDAKGRYVLLDLVVQWRGEAQALRRSAERPESACEAPQKNACPQS